MDITQSIINKLLSLKYTITTAESCTGGLLAGKILDVPGASSVYNEGHITYSNDAKVRILGVQEKTLEECGAVSPQTAAEMAIGAARIAEAEIALSTTGIAGPGGGTPEKPVGLIYVGCYLKGEVFTREFHFHGTREENRKATVEAALELLWVELQKY